jgi:hypothetical protein
LRESRRQEDNSDAGTPEHRLQLLQASGAAGAHGAPFGASVRLQEGMYVGAEEPCSARAREGEEVVGGRLGAREGAEVGAGLGAADGAEVGIRLGSREGAEVGLRLGS